MPKSSSVVKPTAQESNAVPTGGVRHDQKWVAAPDLLPLAAELDNLSEALRTAQIELDAAKSAMVAEKRATERAVAAARRAAAVTNIQSAVAAKIRRLVRLNDDEDGDVYSP